MGESSTSVLPTRAFPTLGRGPAECCSAGSSALTHSLCCPRGRWRYEPVIAPVPSTSPREVRSSSVRVPRTLGATVSTGDPLGRPRVVRQPNLFGGTDVLSLYGRNGRIRTNRLHCASDAATNRVVQQSRQLERARLVELPRPRPGRAAARAAGAPLGRTPSCTSFARAVSCRARSTAQGAPLDG
jgi:hypothetical protein